MFEHQIWFPFMKGLVHYSIFWNDKLLIPKSLPRHLNKCHGLLVNIKSCVRPLRIWWPHPTYSLPVQRLNAALWLVNHICFLVASSHIFDNCHSQRLHSKSAKVCCVCSKIGTFCRCLTTIHQLCTLELSSVFSKECAGLLFQPKTLAHVVEQDQT